jgi:hypothetical protein
MSPFGAAESSIVSELYALASGAATWKRRETGGETPPSPGKRSPVRSFVAPQPKRHEKFTLLNRRE